MNHLQVNGSARTGKILSRYVKKNALYAMVGAVLALWALQVLFSALAEIEALSASYTYSDALTFIAYRSPYFLAQFIPTGALLGAVVGLGLLANKAELIVMRAAGVSIYRIVGWALQPAFLFVLVALAINQFVLPHSNLKANQVRKPDTKLLASVNGYWTMQKNTNAADAQGLDKQTVNSIVFIDYADAKGNIGEVKRWDLDADNNLISLSTAAGGSYVAKEVAKEATNQFSNANEAKEAKEATLNSQNALPTQYYWQLNDIATLSLSGHAAINKSSADAKPAGMPSTKATVDTQTGTPSTASFKATVDTQTGTPSTASLLENSLAQQHRLRQSESIILDNKPLVTKSIKDSEVLALPISPSSVYLLTRRAEDLSLTQLYAHKLFNQAQGTRSLEHELAFWQKLLSPFAVLSLVIVACSFVFGSLRTHSLGLRIVVAIIFALLFSYVQDLTGFVTLATGVSPLLMVLLPIVGSALLGFYLLKRQS